MPAGRLFAVGIEYSVTTPETGVGVGVAVGAGVGVAVGACVGVAVGAGVLVGSGVGVGVTTGGFGRSVTSPDWQPEAKTDEAKASARRRRMRTPRR
jgi:hypothetical protein